MTQTDFGTIVATTKSGTQLAADLNAWRDTVHSAHAGTAQPSYAVAGLIWADSTAGDYVVKMVDAANDDVVLFVMDATSNVARVCVDADQDTYLSAATDDEIRVRIGGVDSYTLTSAGWKTLLTYHDFLDANGNINARFSKVASAVNYLDLGNAVTANAPTLTATGGDTNVSLNLVPKGTGTLIWNSIYSIWHSGNDGAGSGLDADLLDGLQRSILTDTGRATAVAVGLPIATWTNVASTAVYARSGSIRVSGFGQLTAIGATNFYLYVSITSVGQSQNNLVYIPAGLYAGLSAHYHVDALTMDGSYTGNLFAYGSAGGTFTGDLNMEG